MLLRLAGCNEMQGFLFARPGPREEIDRLVAGEGVATARRSGAAAALPSGQSDAN